jgi:DNA-binding SARP family transcriptional activator/tetratricopeptide (TPR) repeat protein
MSGTIAQVPMLTISLINGIGLSLHGEDVRLPNRKARAMLAYLAMNNPPEEQRERLTGLLWSESEQDRANTALRQVIHETRVVLKAAGYDSLRSTRMAIGLDRGSFQVDVIHGLAAPDSEETTDMLLRQPRLAESLLGGFEDLDPAFRAWLLGRRQLLHEQILRGLEKSYRDDGLPRRRRRMLAEAVLQQDPTHEDACRMVMRCAAEDGETGAALRAYDALYRLLDSEHDMEPSGATQELVARIKQGEFDRIAPRAISESDQPDVTESAGASLIRAGPDAETGRRGPPWIAVLPFRGLGPDPVPSWLAEGLADDIVRMLAGLREPIVISSNSTRAFRDGNVDLRRIQRDFGARYVVSGTARSTGQALRLSVELADAMTGAVLWARAYDAQQSMVFEAQDQIVSEVVNTLAPRVHEAELRQIRLKRPNDLSAYHLTLEAKDLIFRLEPTTFGRAGDILRQAIALDPGYAAAHASLASWYSLRLGQGWSPNPAEDTLALNRSVQLAVRLDGGNARALALLGHGKTIYELNHDEGVLLCERALDIAPNDAEVWLFSSPTFAYMGNPDEAIRRAERALRLSPQDPFIFRTYHFLCIAHYARQSYEEAAHWGGLSFRANPFYTSNLRTTAACLIELGRPDEARDMAARAMAVEPRFRATDMLGRVPYRDVVRRERYVRQLLDAGIPA